MLLNQEEDGGFGLVTTRSSLQSQDPRRSRNVVPVVVLAGGWGPFLVVVVSGAFLPGLTFLAAKLTRIYL